MLGLNMGKMKEEEIKLKLLVRRRVKEEKVLRGINMSGFLSYAKRNGLNIYVVVIECINCVLNVLKM